MNQYQASYKFIREKIISFGFFLQAFDKDHNKCKSLIQKELTEDEERDLKDNVKTHMKASEKAKFKNLGAADGVSKIFSYKKEYSR
jgi:hypothetical protein